MHNKWVTDFVLFAISDMYFLFMSGIPFWQRIPQQLQQDNDHEYTIESVYLYLGLII